MRVVVVGVGVIGVTYGWLLDEAGHEVAFLVRPHRARRSFGSVASTSR